jgi:hypothetical protein
MHHYPQHTDWSNYYDPSQHHTMYNNTYNNYKTDYNCLNQPPPPPPSQHQHPQSIHPNTDPAMYNGANNYYYYPQQQQQQQQADPYINQNQSQHPAGMEYQHPNTTNFQNNM